MSVPPFLPQPERRPAHDPSNATHEIALALADQLDCVLLACDAERHLLHANRAGCRALHSARILALDGDRVVCVAAPQREWSDAVRDAACRQQCRLFWVGGPSDQAMVVATHRQNSQGNNKGNNPDKRQQKRSVHKSSFSYLPPRKSRAAKPTTVTPR